MLAGSVQEGNDVHSSGSRGDAATGIEVAADGTGDAVFVHLADINEPVAVFCCPVIPVLEQFAELGEMEAQPPAPRETAAWCGGQGGTAIQVAPCERQWHSYALTIQN